MANGTLVAYLCPFCREEICRFDYSMAFDKIEEICRTHLVEEHPIRWRLSPKIRRAMRQSQRLNP